MVFDTFEVGHHPIPNILDLIADTQYGQFKNVGSVIFSKKEQF